MALSSDFQRVIQPQAPQTFRTMQQQGIARPAPKAPMATRTSAGPRPVNSPFFPSMPTGGAAPGKIITTRAEGQGTGGQPAAPKFNLPQELIDKYKNPSAYNTDMATKTFERLNTRLSEGFDIQRQQLEEEMARRGIGASSIYGGRMGDLGTQQARAQADLAEQVNETAAKQQQEDWYRALQAMTGYDQQLQDNRFRDRTYNDQLDQTQWERLARMAGY